MTGNYHRPAAIANACGFIDIQPLAIPIKKTGGKRVSCTQDVLHLHRKSWHVKRIFIGIVDAAAMFAALFNHEPCPAL